MSLFWWFYPHLRQGNTLGGHWFVRRSFFPVWGRSNFLILLLSADLTAVLPQPSQVVASHLTPPIASKSFYLSCLHSRICSSPTVISKGDRQPSELVVSHQLVQAGARQVMVVLNYYYYYLVFYLESFRSGITTLTFILFSLEMRKFGPFLGCFFFRGEGGGPKAPLVLLILRFTIIFSWHM